MGPTIALQSYMFKYPRRQFYTMLANHLVALAALCLASLATAQEGNPCGVRLPPCANDQRCVADMPTCPDLRKCRGTCVLKNQYPQCGGNQRNAPKCNKDSKCIDDPRTPSSCGMACDAPGICVPKRGTRYCGGFAGLACPRGQYCYDVMNDGCNPLKGGADCQGMCL